MPRAYFWLRDQPDVKALIELPLGDAAQENGYLYAATIHWKPIANGTSGYTADSYLILANHIRLVPHADGFDLLRQMGFTHIVLHIGTKEVRPKIAERWEERFGSGPERRVEKVYEEEGIAIYQLVQ